MRATWSACNAPPRLSRNPWLDGRGARRTMATGEAGRRYTGRYGRSCPRASSARSARAACRARSRWLRLRLGAAPARSAETSAHSAEAPARPRLAFARAGLTTSFVSGSEFGRERYEDDGDTLVCHLDAHGTKAVERLSRSAHTVRIEQDGKSVVRAVPKGTVVLENLCWQQLAVAAEEHRDASTPTPVHVLVPGPGVTLDGTIQVDDRAEGRPVRHERSSRTTSVSRRTLGPRVPSSGCASPPSMPKRAGTPRRSLCLSRRPPTECSQRLRPQPHRLRLRLRKA